MLSAICGFGKELEFVSDRPVRVQERHVEVARAVEAPHSRPVSLTHIGGIADADVCDVHSVMVLRSDVSHGQVAT